MRELASRHGQGGKVLTALVSLSRINGAKDDCKIFCTIVVLSAVAMKTPKDLDMIKPPLTTAWFSESVRSSNAKTVLGAIMPTPRDGAMSMRL